MLGGILGSWVDITPEVIVAWYTGKDLSEQQTCLIIISKDYFEG